MERLQSGPTQGDTVTFVTALTWTLVFLTLKKSLRQPEIKVHLEVLFIFRSVLLDFQSFTEKPFF